MRFRYLILLFLLLNIPENAYSQESYRDKRLREIIKEQGQAEVSLEYTNRKDADRLTRNASISKIEKGRIYIVLSGTTVDWFIFQKFNYVIEEESSVRSAINIPAGKSLALWDSYPSYTQYDSIMRNFVVRYPSLCKIDTIGTSINGKLVLALKISDKVSENEDEPEVFYTSTIHGDETAGFVLMLRFADYLLSNYNSDSRVKDLADNLQIWINPLSNPDGTYRNGNVISSPVRFNANGVDLNRNFPDPLAPSIVQEKETRDMMKFLQKHRFVISANFHSGAEVVNYPWDRWYSKFHADDQWFYDISREYADTVHKYSGPAYMNGFNNGVTRGSDWYVIYGGRQDYVTYTLHGREVTIELDDSYVTPGAQLPLLWEYNYHSFIGYLENALYGIHGKIVDAKTSEPVQARIFIPNHDIDSSHVFSDSLTGSFTRLIAAGSWNLSVTAKGYNDTIVTNVTVSPWQRTDITIRMTPISTGTDSLFPVSPSIYPNPASSQLKALLPDYMDGEIIVKVYSQTGSLVKIYNTVAEQGIPILIEIKDLSQGVYYAIFINRITGKSMRSSFVVTR
jgi:hypothetical protein